MPTILLSPIEVTGTRLGRELAESPINYNVITREALSEAGRARLAEVLRELPEFPGNQISDLVAFNSARGVMAADLRGLGAGNTLVLVNGRRVTVNASAFDVITTFVDTNRFPTSFLERVEILKSGASAVYGADAVGGVVNLVTRRQPRGGESVISYGNSVRTDAAEISASVFTGTTQGRLGLAVGVDYFERHSQAHQDRAFTRTANLIPAYTRSYDYYASLPASQLAGYDGRSLTSANARIVPSPGQVNGRNGVNLPTLPIGASISTLPGTRASGSGVELTSATPSFSAAFTGATGGQFTPAAAASFVVPELTRGDPGARSLFDFNEQIWTTPAVSRIAATARLDHEIAAGMAWFAEFQGGRNRTRTQYHPSGFSATVPRTNAFNPFGVDVIASWRIPDAGPRKSLTEDDHTALLAGLRQVVRSSYRWELATAYSRDEFVDTTRNVYDAAKVNAALAGSQPSTTLNPFGGRNYRHDPTLIDALKTEAWFGGTADLLSIDAHVGGSLLRLPSGAVQAVAFAEQRRERFSGTSDEASRAGNILGYGQSGADAAFSRTVRALAAEVRVPLWNPEPAGLEKSRLAVEGAARLEEFSASFRSGLKPSVGLVLRPAEGLVLRASGASTFRAPSLPQLYSPQGDGYTNSVTDPRRPVALTGDESDGPNVPRLIRQGGNPDLRAEKGITYQVSTGWTLRRVPGLEMEATWFRYELENVISGVSPVYVLENELGGLGALVHRQPGLETLVNRTVSPIPVLSGPAGQTTLVASGQSAVVPGRLQRIDTFTVNLSRRRLIGWDFSLRHRQALPVGRVGAAAAVTYTDRAEFAYDRHSPMINNAGGVSTPRWRGRASLDWSRNRWSAGSTISYIASSGYHSTEAYYQKPYRVVHFRATYSSPPQSWARGIQITIGLEDAFDETPPLYPDPPIGFNYGQVTRPQGRFWRLSVKRMW
ncbi:MAG: TonB-dependent receptor [Verrucomicrobia bacterium]|nr:TonB-dependent receptor [Verrucomicrobiota bacterium]